MGIPASHFFMSDSRENVTLQKRVIAGLRERGVNVWVDVERLIPGSPSWEREIERAIRAWSMTQLLLAEEVTGHRPI